MDAYFRNHQLYVAEKSDWLDRHVVKTSKRALLKIDSWKSISSAGDSAEQVRLVAKLVKDSLLTPVSNRTILRTEGFYTANLDN